MLPDLHSPMLADGLMDWWTSLNFRDTGASTVASDSDRLFYYVYAISAFFFVLLMGLMVYFTFKYRRKAGVAPVRSASHNTLLELSWSVIPTAILVWMFFAGFWGYAEHVIAPAQATEVVVEASKWNWKLTYPNGAVSPVSTRTRGMGDDLDEEKAGGVVDTPIFVVPEKHPVQVRMSSIDVIHAFWVPDFRVKFDVFPNRFTSLWFEASGIKGDRKLKDTGPWKKWAGTPYEDHWVFCAEYCGSNHSEMSAIIRVVPHDVYLDIIKDWSQPKGKPHVVGAALYKMKGCNSCHSIDGSGNVGPSWKDIYGRETGFTDGTRMSKEQRMGVDFANYVRESVYEPGKKVVAGFPNQMQTYQGKVNEQELEAIIAYMKSISAATTPAEKEAMEAAPEIGGEK
jgi:cytochrome c oxidase subunit II